MATHRLFLLGVRRPRASEVIETLRAHGFSCGLETERRISEAQVTQALLVAQSEDLDALRALQARLTALECDAFVSESTSWRANLWEALSAPWRAGFLNGLTSLVSARTRALAIAVAVFFALLAGFVAVSSLASRDGGGSVSPLERLTETRDGPRAPAGGANSSRGDEPAQHAHGSSVGGGASSGRDTEGDPTATPLEAGAFFGGLILSLLFATALAKRFRRAGRVATRVAQGVAFVALGVGLWAGTRPREVYHERGLARAGLGGATMAAAEGAGELDEDADASTPESAGGGAGGSRGRALRGPFDRFVRGLEVRSPQGPPPTFSALFASMQAAPPAVENAVAEGTSDESHGAERGDAHGDHAHAHEAHAAHTSQPHTTAARDEPHHRSGHGDRHPRDRHASESHASDQHASESHRRRGSRHARRDEAATNARGDAGVVIAARPDASVATIARTRATSGAQGSGDTASNDGSGGGNAAARLRGAGAQPSTRNVGAQRDEVIDIRRERPRLGPWFLVGLCLGASLASSVRRKEDA